MVIKKDKGIMNEVVFKVYNSRCSFYDDFLFFYKKSIKEFYSLLKRDFEVKEVKIKKEVDTSLS